MKIDFGGTFAAKNDAKHCISLALNDCQQQPEFAQVKTKHVVGVENSGGDGLLTNRKQWDFFPNLFEPSTFSVLKAINVGVI